MFTGLFDRVMKCVLLFVFLILPAQAQVQVSYTLEELDLGRWKATYRIDNNDSLLDISWLSIYFDYGLYNALSIETPSVLAEQWDQDVWDPMLVSSLPIPGLFDVQAKFDGILPSQSLAGFAIAFDWLGEGRPILAQRFEVYDDPANLQSLRAGTTVYIPEPATLLVLSVGSLFAFGRYGKRYFC